MRVVVGRGGGWRRSTKFVVAALGAYFLLLPLALSYVFTHAARAVVPAAELGAACENVGFQAPRRPHAERP